MEEITLPIAHWSYSALRTFLENRWLFRRKYILKIYDDKSTQTMMVGKACHKALEIILKGGTHLEGIQAGHDLLEKERDENIDYGKEGSRSDMVKDYSQAIQFYLAEMPKWDVVAVEEYVTSWIEIAGTRSALPLKCGLDLVVREGEDLVYIDHKIVSKYTDPAQEGGNMTIQAVCAYHVIKDKYGKPPKRAIFNECKVSKNRDGSPQLRPFVIDFEAHPEYLRIFETIYDGATREIARPDCMYLPSFSGFDGGKIFTNVLAADMGVERPLATKRQEAPTYVEKNFVPSTGDLLENENLTNEERIRLKLQEFGLPVEMRDTFQGPTVSLYTFRPSRGAAMREFESRDKDLAIALKARSIRIQAPIMGTDLVGVEVPNAKRTFCKLDPSVLKALGNPLSLPIGVNVYGQMIAKPLDAMPHLLVAGATGSGKSVMINVIIQSLMAQNEPDALQFVMIDPKRVELSEYRDSPYLRGRIYTEATDAEVALSWLVTEMERRYDVLDQASVRDLNEYTDMGHDPLPRIVVIIDEYADLVLGDRQKRCEGHVVRLAQKARAAGIHLVIGTQRPSVNVVTGILKANIPARIAFATASRIDSQTILDAPGAEQLLGKGDMLWADPTARTLTRLQSYYL